LEKLVEVISMNNREIYVKFLSSTQTLDSDVTLSDVDLLGQKLLEILAIASEKNEPMTVSQAMGAVWIASPATLHRKIRNLIDAGYVSSNFSGKNRRTRYLVPTEKANNFFSYMGRNMRLCLNLN
jgi:DNA-binding MarR family transcriptional regulator